MKTKLFKYVPIAIGAIMMMASCADDDEENPLNDNPTVPKPTVEVSVNKQTNEDTYQVELGDSVSINMTAFTAAGGGADLETVSFIQSGNNATTTDIVFTASESGEDYDFSSTNNLPIRNADDNRLILSGSFQNITSNVGNTTYEFIVEDKDGLKTSHKFTIEVVTTTPFTTIDSGEVYHILGSNIGSWSLTTDAAISSSAGNESNAHIINTNTVGSFDGSFKVGDSLSNVSFVKAVSSFKYDNATVESADTAFAMSSNLVRTTTPPSVGDVYVFRIDGDYVVVKITAIDPTADCNGCANPGKMTFEYKK